MASFHHHQSGIRFEGNRGSDLVHAINFESHGDDLTACGFVEGEWKGEDCMTGSLGDLAAATKVLPQGFRIPRGLDMRSKNKVSGKVVLSW